MYSQRQQRFGQRHMDGNQEIIQEVLDYLLWLQINYLLLFDCYRLREKIFSYKKVKLVLEGPPNNFLELIDEAI